MNLYAAGFNAWRQLEFSPLETSGEEPGDVASFQKILSDEHIEIQYASLTYTLGEWECLRSPVLCLIFNYGKPILLLDYDMLVVPMSILS